MSKTPLSKSRAVFGRVINFGRGIGGNRRVLMIYLEGFMTLQMGHMGRYKGVYNTSEGLYGTIEGHV